MCDPFHIPVIPKINMRPKPFLLCMQIVKNNPVINTTDAYFLFLGFIEIEQLVAFRNQFGYTNGLYSEIIFGAIKIYPGLLFVGLDFEKNGLFGRSFTQ